MKQYDVTVSFGPETLRVYAQDAQHAKGRAVWMIGLAGFMQQGTLKAKQVRERIGSTPVC